MSQYSRLTTSAKTQQPCFGSYGVPFEVDVAVTSLIEKTRDGCPPSSRAMRRSAEQIALRYPSFLCAQYALASVILNSPGPHSAASVALNRAWSIGTTALMEKRIVDVHYSASQGNASFLNAGAGLAKQKVLQSDLIGALTLVNRVIRLDVEDASDGRFVKAHIEQLMGDKTAATSLAKVASSHDPKAFYALGLEYLRVHRAQDAALSFREGIEGAPEVAEILLGLDHSHKGKKNRSPLSAQQYVETFCLAEWTSTELAALGKVATLTLRAGT
ncbi:MAG: hypothetical protein V4448_17985 [Pseudomonadota bacterium]